MYLIFSAEETLLLDQKLIDLSNLVAELRCNLNTIVAEMELRWIGGQMVTKIEQKGGRY